MLRRLTLRGCCSAALALTIAVVAASSAQAAGAVSLSLPQGTAFAILGHSCGGIQEKSYATGFNPASGFPTGVVTMSTSCGGSGRGGGYHSTLYSASAGVTWDFTGAVVSYVVPVPAVTINPSLSAFDAHGNQVYNQSGSAFLILAAGFVPTARVISVSAVVGPASGGTAVTITGTGFTGATAVRFGSTAAASFTVNSSTSITAVSPAAAGGTVDIAVVNAGGSSTASSADQFTFVAAPIVSGLAPKSGTPGGGTAVTITGAHLGSVTRVTFGGTASAFVVNGDTSITAYSPVAEAAGPVDVRATSIGGTSARTTADRFTYIVLTPVVSSVSPSTGSLDGGTAVTITGANLDGATEVDFGGNPSAFWANPDGSLTAYSPAATVPATVDVVVISYGVRSVKSAADAFQYLAAPVVTAVSPATGPVAGGTTVAITGTDLSTATEVDFGGLPATFTTNADGSITAVSPAGTAGSVDVTVIAGGGVSAPSAADQFTYADVAPVVSGIAPSSGPEAGGTLVIISGANLTNTAEVDFGGVAVPFAVIDDATVAALSPAGAAHTTVDVTATTGAGTSATSAADAFTFAPTPVVTGVDPSSGSVDGGTSVTITGADLSNATEVDFGGVPASFTVNADGSITAVSPPSVAGTVDVTVITDGGPSAPTAADAFTYL